MALRPNILATAAILLPVAAGAQSAQQDPLPAAQPATSASAQPAADTTAQTADAKAQANVQADAQADVKAGAVKAATKADVKAGAAVYDAKGNSVGKIQSVDGKGAVLDTGKVQVKIPVSSLAKGDKGLVIGMSKAEIEAAAKKS